MGSKSLRIAALALLTTGLRAAPLEVTVGIPPLVFFARAIGGNLVECRALIKPSDSPHDFQPSPRQLAQASNARLYLSVGLPFETRLADKLRSINPSLRVIDVSADVPRRTMNVLEKHCDHGCTHDHESDPHVWLSPRSALRLAVAVRDALRDVDGDNANVYVRNCSALLADLQGLDDELAAALAPFAGKSFFVFHPAFGYFADRYGLHQIPVEIEGKEPSARQLAELIRRARTEQVSVIFVQRQFNQRAAEKIAQSIGGAVVPLDPLAENYIENLRSIAREVRTALER